MVLAVPSATDSTVAVAVTSTRPPPSSTQGDDGGRLRSIPHFVVLQHGVHGSTYDLRLIKSLLTAAKDTQLHGADVTPHRFVVFDSDVNWGLHSHAGVMTCADKLEKELIPALLNFLEFCDNAGDTYAATRYFSCVGHSFGGLIMRDIVHRIFSNPLFAPQLRFHTFVTVATPHTGVTYGPAYHPKELLGKVVGRLASRTVQELRLEAPAGENCLAEALIDDAHVAALKNFKRRLLVAAVNNDHLVAYQAATLQPELPVAALRQLLEDSRATDHTLALMTLSPATITEDLVAAAVQSAAARIALRLRSQMTFDVMPVVSDAWYPNAHAAVVSKRGWWASQRMDDVSVLIAHSLCQPTADDDV